MTAPKPTMTIGMRSSSKFIQLRALKVSCPFHFLDCEPVCAARGCRFHTPTSRARDSCRRKPNQSQLPGHRKNCNQPDTRAKLNEGDYPAAASADSRRSDAPENSKKHSFFGALAVVIG